MGESRLFIVANRLPVNICEEEGALQIKPSAGGLVTAINSYLDDNRSFQQTFWAGVPGCTPGQWREAERKIPAGPYTFLPIFVSNPAYDAYYNGFSNSLLWPLFHYFPSYAEYSEDQFEQYLRINEQFCEGLARQLRPGDTVWIHDYHLMPLAGMLREKAPGVSIGFFLHIPFPSFEVFRLLPRKWGEALLKGALGADLVGFHTIDYATHFLNTVQMILGLDHDRHIIRFQNRLVKVDVFPISIDYEKFHQAYDAPEVRRRRESLLQKFGGKQIIFSVDRLDYTKGVQNRLRAYEHFLLHHPEYIEKVSFIMVIVPSRDTIPKYCERKKMIDESISSINSSIGNFHWQPIIYQYSTLSFEEMMALYTSCDLALITPLRDGMNLVSKEFIASRKDGRGVLVISEMAGAARELTNALTINPNDIAEISEKIRTGLQMPPEEQAARLAPMQQRVKSYNVQAWSSDFITELRQVKARQLEFQVKFLDEYTRHAMVHAYRAAGRRLLLLDYDGTLVSFSSNPDAAVPTEGLMQLLQNLCNQEENELYIISGRSASWLEQWFAHLPINMIAEHGARQRTRSGTWTSEVHEHPEWKDKVRRIMQVYQHRCAHSLVEEKEFSMAWHYRNAVPEQGKLRAQELVAELNAYAHNRDLQVVMGNKIVEVRNTGIDKGACIKKILHRNSFDFILAMGDDRTDEDMFRALARVPNSYTIKVGPEASYAHFNLYNPQMVVSLLEALSHYNQASLVKHPLAI